MDARKLGLPRRKEGGNIYMHTHPHIQGDCICIDNTQGKVPRPGDILMMANLNRILQNKIIRKADAGQM